MISFEFYSVPIAKQRPRFGRGTVYTPASTKSWEMAIGQLCKAAMNEPIMAGAVSVKITITERYLDSWPKWKVDAKDHIGNTKKPDLDNILKTVLDGMNGVAYFDDSQVVALNVVKSFSEETKTSVEVLALPLVRHNVKNIKEYETQIKELL